MSDSNPLGEKHAKNRRARREQIREWAAFVRSHPDQEWGKQVNEIVDAQLQSARHFEDERPKIDRMGDSALPDDSVARNDQSTEDGQ